MSIRPMTSGEIVAGLRRAAVVCVEQQRGDWISIGVCRAEATYHAACDWVDNSDVSGDADTPDHAAFFLLLCAEASDA